MKVVQRGLRPQPKRTVMLSEAEHLLLPSVFKKKQILRCAQNDTFEIFVAGTRRQQRDGRERN